MATIDEFATTCILWAVARRIYTILLYHLAEVTPTNRGGKMSATHVSLKVGLDDQHELLLGKPAGAGRAK